MVDACRARYGRIDILHNNVGIGGLGSPVDTPEELWERVMRVNVTSMFLTCKHALPVMLDQGGGAIVNVSSLSATKAIRPEVAYATSKGAVNAFTINVAMSYADRGIRCNAILPGLMDTPMAVDTRARTWGQTRAEVAAMRDAKVPLRRKMGTAWDVANAALFLASDETDFITGVSLPVDGGSSLRRE
jgi:NAD(P)-dependent dehydrogenase (short-subunit alcohol dehydrogenase family)